MILICVSVSFKTHNIKYLVFDVKATVDLR